MIRVLDQNFNLIIEGTFIDILKKNFKDSIELGEKNALNYYNFCNYLVNNNIKISKESLLENVCMNYSKDFKVEVLDFNDDNSKLDFWDEYCKYLLKSCKDIYDLIEVADANDINIDISNDKNIEIIHTLNDNMFKIGYKENKYLLIRD